MATSRLRVSVSTEASSLVQVDLTSLDTEMPSYTAPTINNVVSGQIILESAENATAVTTLTGVNPNIDGSLAWTITNYRPDHALFAIDSGTGALTFLSAPDYETPLDYSGTYSEDSVAYTTDNGYWIRVRLTHSTSALYSEADVNINVTNVIEGGPTLLAEGVYRAHSDAAFRLGGAAMPVDSLGNILLGQQSPGGSEVRAFDYFTATENSAFMSYKRFFTAIAGGSYSGGTGGSIEMTVWPADTDGITPIETGPHLGRSTYNPGLVSGEFATGLGEENLTHLFTGGSADLVKGNRYVITIENITANKDVDYISVDNFSFDTDQPAPFIANGDWGAAFQARADGVTTWTGATVTDRGSATAFSGHYQKPCGEITYANGAKWGIAGTITGNLDNVNNAVQIVTNTTPVRARIDFVATTDLVGAYVNMSVRAGDGDCGWALKSGATTLASGSFTVAKAEETNDFFGLGVYIHGRYAMDFGGVHTQTAGSILDLELTPDAGVTLLVAANNYGRPKNYAAPLARVDHYSEQWNGASWDAINAYGTTAAGYGALDLLLIKS